jgi:hypothetical protein
MCNTFCMTSENIDRRTLLKKAGLAAAGALGVGLSEANAQTTEKPLDNALNEHPGLIVAKRFVQAHDDFYKQRPKFKDSPVAVEDVLLLQAVTNSFLREHAAAFGFDVTLPRPPGFDVWSLGKATGLALRGGADARAAAFIEQELDRIQWASMTPSAKDSMPVWDWRS